MSSNKNIVTNYDMTYASKNFAGISFDNRPTVIMCQYRYACRYRYTISNAYHPRTSNINPTVTRRNKVDVLPYRTPFFTQPLDMCLGISTVSKDCSFKKTLNVHTIFNLLYSSSLINSALKIHHIR